MSTPKTETVSIRRQPTAATLYKHITDYVETTGFEETVMLKDVLDSLRDRIVAEAIRR